MRVFVTGATGFIGSEVVKELIAAGHQVLGLIRSEAGARALVAAGAEVHHGNLADLKSLQQGAASADGVIHLAFIHDFSKFKENCEMGRRAIEAVGAVLAGSDRPFIVTSGTGMGNLASGQLSTENNFNADQPHPRSGSELAANSLLECGVHVSAMRLPQVHNTIKQGLVTYAIAVAREKGLSAYIRNGQNRWPAAHVLDVARLYRLAIEKHEAGARYHAVAEEGVTMRAIAEALGHGLNVPVKSISAEEAPAHLGWLSMFAGYDMPASSALTRQRLGWQPVGPGLITDLEQMFQQNGTKL